MRIKAYTKESGLVVSREFFDASMVTDLLQELNWVQTIKAAYLTNGKGSKRINFQFNSKKTRPLYWIRSDGVRTRSLSVHPENYPMTGHYADGSIEIFKLDR